jgi:hypothetical protein
MFPRSRPLALIGVGLMVIGGALAAWGRWQMPQAPALTDDIRRIRAELVEELRPVSLSNCEWVRVGSANDGGYPMCGNLLAGIQTAYSYGIGGDDAWGCQISAKYKVPVHQYDCFNPTSPPCKGADPRLNVECVGPRAEKIDGRAFDTLASQMSRNGDAAKAKVVKMDIEGAEWQAILAAPDDLFDSIVQMPMELHGTDTQEVLDGLRKLKKHFYLVAVHFNNWNCSNDFAPFPNFAYQVLLVNRKIGVIGEPPAGARTLASALAPDNKRAPECVTSIGYLPAISKN